MAINSRYLFVVNMDVDADKEALFNQIYDTEHIPNLLKVPGVRGVTRMAGEPFTLSRAGLCGTPWRTSRTRSHWIGS
jgi:hypothetical protein